MSRQELKEFLLDHREDELAWSAFFEKIGELGLEGGYSPDLSFEEMERIIQDKLNQDRSTR